MSHRELSYVTLDVFTSQRLKGNQLAVVEVPDEPLSHDLMKQVAREFNFSETVFLQTSDAQTKGRYRINIFTPVVEINFAGHPTIGTGHVLFKQLLPALHVLGETPQSIDVVTNSGSVKVMYDPRNSMVSAEVPHNVHVHTQGTPKQNIIDTQPILLTQEEVQDMRDSYPAVSIVKGVTYTLVDFTESPQLFASIQPSRSQDTPLDEDWSPSFTGTVYYRSLDSTIEGNKIVQNLRMRMMAINLEDPACGSGACSLGTYLALQDGKANGEYRFCIDQGSEIGRDSKIIVDVSLNEPGTEVKGVVLSGQATIVTQGTLFLPK